jgi:hypothetical protein
VGVRRYKGAREKLAQIGGITAGDAFAVPESLRSERETCKDHFDLCRAAWPVIDPHPSGDVAHRCYGRAPSGPSQKISCTTC